MNQTITVIGSGYVGLATGVTLAYLGYQVICVDIDRHKIEKLSGGQLPFYEPHMQNLLELCKDRIQFSTNLSAAIKQSGLAFITVGTPPKEDGSTDLTAITAVAKAIGEALEPHREFLVVTKSTVPMGTGHYIKVMAEQAFFDKYQFKPARQQICVASNPEFLREGSAIHDALYPDRIVIGAEEHKSLLLLQKLFEPLITQTFTAPAFAPRPQYLQTIPMLQTSRASAEAIKYASNTFLALKISFINQLAGLCERVGADVTQVAQGMGLDKRIGEKFLRAGIGWGGSCFGKDTQALISSADEFGYDMSILRAVLESNRNQHFTVIEKLQQKLGILKGKKISILGLSFKPDTDDVRETPAAAVIRELLRRGAIVQAHDPVAIPAFQHMYPQLNIDYTEEASEVFIDSDAVVLVTEWAMYDQLDWAKCARQMRSKLVIDGRNFLNREKLILAGIYYVGVGRTEEVLAVEPRTVHLEGHISQAEGDWYAASTNPSL